MFGCHRKTCWHHSLHLFDLLLNSLCLPHTEEWFFSPRNLCCPTFLPLRDIHSASLASSPRFQCSNLTLLQEWLHPQNWENFVTILLLVVQIKHFVVSLTSWKKGGEGQGREKPKQLFSCFAQLLSHRRQQRCSQLIFFATIITQQTLYIEIVHSGIQQSWRWRDLSFIYASKFGFIWDYHQSRVGVWWWNDIAISWTSLEQDPKLRKMIQRTIDIYWEGTLGTLGPAALPRKMVQRLRLLPRMIEKNTCAAADASFSRIVKISQNLAAICVFLATF